MPVGLKDRQDQDQQHNPGQTNWDNTVGRNQQAASSLSASEQDAFNDMATHFNDTADSSQEDANIKNVKDAEESPNSYTKTPTETTKKSDKNKLSRKQAPLNFIKEKGPLALILMVFIGGSGIISSIASSGLAILEMKNALVQDLNDALPSLDKRSQHIMYHRLKGNTKGFCSSHAAFRCRYKSMSERQAKKLEKAGFTLEDKHKTKLGRIKTSGLTYTDSHNVTRTVEAKNYKRTMRHNVEFISKIHKAYNPRFASFRDAKAKSVYKNFKVSLKRLLNGSKEDMKKQIDEQVKKGNDEIDKRRIHKTSETDEDGKPIYRDADNNVVHLNEEQRAFLEKDHGENGLKKFAGKTHGVKAMLTGGFSAVNIVGGMHAMTCRVIGMIHVTSLAAKNLKYAQLLRYVMPLLNTADSIKTGDATMEAVSFLGDVATHVDLRPKTLNEDKGTLGDILKDHVFGGDVNNVKIEPEENPHYGDSAFDSAGFKLAAYGEVSNLDMRESQYKLGGTPGGNKLNGMVDAMRDAVPGFSEDTCAFWKNPIVQWGGLGLSMALIFVTGGGSAVAQGAMAASLMVASTVITSYLQSMINDIVKGTIADSETQGLDAGNAWFSGGAALMSSTASAHGLSPLSTPKEISQTQRIAAEVKQKYAKVARYEARDTPFDIYNQYSFLGSIAFKIYPSVASTKSFASTMLLSPFTYLSAAIQAMSPTADAAVTSPPSRFKRCEDPSFKKINIASADQMCNLRFGNSPDEINADPEKVAQWMIDARQIDPIEGDVKQDREAVEAVQRIPVTAIESASILHDENDPNPPAMTAMIDRSDPTKTTIKTADATSAPQPGDSKDFPIEPEAIKNVRTYAHWLRYCRYGPDDGRTVNFGDEDSTGEDNVLTGISDDAYHNDGRECFKANACKPGQNPNGGSVKQNSDGKWQLDVNGDDAMESRCRPPQYSIYSIFTIDHSTIAAMDDPEEDEQDQAPASGDAKELAKKVAENPNIEFVNPATKNDLLEFARTGKATNYCGQPFTINALLTGTMQTLSKDYKILVNNFGFQDDRNVACDSGQHPKGNAVDLNGIEKIGGGKTSWGSISYSSSEVAVITDYTIAWMDTLAKTDPARGGVGQLGCGGFNIITKRKPNWQGPDGNLHFDDACNHLHIDVRDRNDNTKI